MNADFPCSLLIDDEVELRGCFDRQIAGLGALENLVEIRDDLDVQAWEVDSVDQKATSIGVTGISVDRGKATVRSQSDDLGPQGIGFCRSKPALIA